MVGAAADGDRSLQSEMSATLQFGMSVLPPAQPEVIDELDGFGGDWRCVV